MAAALRFKSFQEAVNAADEKGLVKGQTQVVVRHESGEEAVQEVLVDESTGNLVIFTKEAAKELVS